MSDRLRTKTRRYERLLDEALAAASVAPDLEEDPHDLARTHLRMASAYLEDGRHFQEKDDWVDALAAYSYGHGWLDAAIRAELVVAENASEAGPRNV